MGVALLYYTYALSFVLMREHAVHFFRMNDKNEEDGTLLFTIWLLLGLVGEQTHCVVLSPFSSAKHRRMGANFKFENCTKAHENVDFFSSSTSLSSCDALPSPTCTTVLQPIRLVAAPFFRGQLQFH